MRIILDFDNTIVNSAETIIRLYQKKVFKYEPIHREKIKWDFSPYIPKMHLPWALNMFQEQEFYDNLDFMDNAKEVLERLSKKHELVICTKKHPDGVSMNDQWIRNNLPFIDSVVYLRQDSFDKSLVGGNSIILDDKIECLIEGNRKFRLLFGDYGYQDEYYNNEDIKRHENYHKIIRIRDWLDFEKFINSLK